MSSVKDVTYKGTKIQSKTTKMSYWCFKAKVLLYLKSFKSTFRNKNISMQDLHEHNICESTCGLRPGCV